MNKIHNLTKTPILKATTINRVRIHLTPMSLLPLRERKVLKLKRPNLFLAVSKNKIPCLINPKDQFAVFSNIIMLTCINS